MKKILLISHDIGTPGGPVDKLKTYLENKYEIFSIKHPLIPGSSVKTNLSWKNFSIKFKIPGSLQYIFEGIITLIVTRFYRDWRTKINLAICFDPLGFIDIFLFKNIYGVKKIIYYNLDFSKKRFDNKILSSIYNKLNHFSYKKCDYFFSLREGISDEFDPKNKAIKKYFVVGQTVKINNQKIPRIENSIVYAGAIGSSINFNPMMDALYRLKKKGIMFSLDIYGVENDGGKLRKKINLLKLSKQISFKGSISSKDLTEKILGKYSIGVAPYQTKSVKSAPDYLFQGSVLAAKIVDYISCGLAVIATKINPAFDEIENNEFGYIANTPEEWYSHLNLLLSDKKTLKRFRDNALKYAENFDEKKVFGEVFKKIKF